MASSPRVSTRLNNGHQDQNNSSPTGLGTMTYEFPRGYRRPQFDPALLASLPIRIYKEKGLTLVASLAGKIVGGGWDAQTDSDVECLIPISEAIHMTEEPDSVELRHFLGSSAEHQTQPRVPDSTAPPPQDTTSHPYSPLLTAHQENIDGTTLEASYHHSEPEDMPSDVLLPPPGRPPGPGPGPSFTVPGTPKRSLPRRPHHQRSLDKDSQKIRNLRLEVWSLREKIRRVRKDLRQKQLAKSAADNKYFQFVRAHGLGMTYHNQDISQEQKTIKELFHDCEAARDEYGPLEDDCNLLEDKLSSWEFDLQKLEEHVAREQEMAQSSQAQASEAEYHSAPSSIHSGSEFVQESHPLVSKYLSKMGEVDNLNERLDWRIEEKCLLEEEKETRQLANLELPAPSQAWLDSYEKDQAELMTQLEKAEAEGEELMHQCFSLGLVDKDGNPTDFEQLEQQTFIDDEAVYAGSEKSDFVKFPLLLPKHGTEEIGFDESGPKEGEFSESAGDHINQWLLHILRSSPLGVGLLASTYESETGHIQNEHWEVDVLAFWYADGARKSASDYPTGSSVGAMQETRQDPHSDGSYARSKARDQHLSSLLSFGQSVAESIESTGKHTPLLPAALGPPKLGDSTAPESTGRRTPLPSATPASQRLEIYAAHDL